MAYYYRQEVHHWYIANLTPKEMKRIVGRRLPYIRDCIARKKFPHKMLYELLVAKPCPLVAPDDMPNPDALLWKKRKERPADTPAFMGGIPPPPEPPESLPLPPVVGGQEAPPYLPNLADVLPDGARLMILTPGRYLTLQTEYFIRTLCDNSGGKIVFGEPETIYDVHMARNRMADRYIQSKIEYSLWCDPDNIAPCERPEWWKRNVPAARRWSEPLYSSMNAVNKLVGNHRQDPKNSVVGACYFDRFGRGVPMFGAGRVNATLRATLNNGGPRNQLISAGNYAGLGMLMVHRQVYLDIMESQPEWAVDRAKAPWLEHGYGFFDRLNHQGDDPSFGERCIKAGHQPMIDLSVISAHVGDYGYTHETLNPELR